jgi:large subunit ribosomal protein L5
MAKEQAQANETASAEAASKPVPPRLRERFKSEVAPKLGEKFGRTNPMSLPKIEKITINVNMGRHLEGTKVPANVKDQVLATLSTISGQKPIVIKAKKSVSNFKVREGYDSAAMVTLRRERMWYFLDRFINLATPRIKDFRGLSDTAFDHAGNYSVGLNEQGVFPEIDMARATFSHGMNVNIVFSRSTPELSRFVLEELGFPFRKPEDAKR